MNQHLIIIPAYNEAASVAEVVTAAFKVYPAAQIVVIDDGSNDETAALAASAGAVVLQHPFNLGYGAALQTGYKYAAAKGYSFLAQMDADGQHEAAYLSKIFSELEDGYAEVVIGSRFLDLEMGGTYQAGSLRRIGMRLFAAIASLIICQRLTDPTSGFLGFNQKALTLLISDDFPCDYPDADVLVMLHRCGLRIKEIPVPMYVGARKKSLHHGVAPIYYVFKMLLSILMALLRRPPEIQPNDSEEAL